MLLLFHSSHHAPRRPNIIPRSILVKTLQLHIRSVWFLANLPKTLIEIRLAHLLVILELLKIYKHLVSVLEVLGVANVLTVF